LDPAKAYALVDTLGQGQVAERFEQILEDPEIAIVSIASYDDAHTDQVVQQSRQ